MKIKVNPAHNKRLYRNFSSFFVALLVIFMVMAVAGCGGGGQKEGPEWRTKE